jgi:hypothetical protein
MARVFKAQLVVFSDDRIWRGEHVLAPIEDSVGVGSPARYRVKRWSRRSVALVPVSHTAAPTVPSTAAGL